MTPSANQATAKRPARLYQFVPRSGLFVAAVIPPPQSTLHDFTTRTLINKRTVDAGKSSRFGPYLYFLTPVYIEQIVLFDDAARKSELHLTFCNDYDYCMGVIESKAKTVDFRKMKHMSATVSGSNPAFPVILQFQLKKSSVLFAANLNLRHEFAAASESGTVEKFDGDITLKAVGGRSGALCKFKGSMSVAGPARTSPILTKGEVKAQLKAKNRMSSLENASACFTLSNVIDKEVRMLSKTVDKILSKQTQVTRANERLFPEHNATYTLPIGHSPDPVLESPRRKKQKKAPVIPRCALPEYNKKPTPVDHTKPFTEKPVKKSPRSKRRPATTGGQPRPKPITVQEEPEVIEVIEEAQTSEKEEKMKSEKEEKMKSEKEEKMKSEKEGTMKSEKEGTMKSEKEEKMKSEKKESSSSSSSYEYITEEYEVEPSVHGSDSESILSDSSEEKAPVKKTRRIKKRKPNKPKKEKPAAEKQASDVLSKHEHSEGKKGSSAADKSEKSSKIASEPKAALADVRPKKEKKEDSILSGSSSSSSSMSFVSDSHNESRANSPTKNNTSNISGFVVNDSPIAEKKPEESASKGKVKKSDSVISGISDLSSTDIDESLLLEEEKKAAKADEAKSKSDAKEEKSKSDAKEEKSKSDAKEEKSKSDAKEKKSKKDDSLEEISGLSGISGLSKDTGKVGDKDIDELLEEIESDSDKPKKSRANTIKLPSEGEGNESIGLESSSSGFF